MGNINREGERRGKGEGRRERWRHRGTPLRKNQKGIPEIKTTGRREKV